MCKSLEMRGWAFRSLWDPRNRQGFKAARLKSLEWGARMCLLWEEWCLKGTSWSTYGTQEEIKAVFVFVFLPWATDQEQPFEPGRLPAYLLHTPPSFLASFLPSVSLVPGAWDLFSQQEGTAPQWPDALDSPLPFSPGSGSLLLVATLWEYS